MSELAELIHKWPPAVINHMTWRQREIEMMRKVAKIKFRQKHQTPCTLCGTIINSDMYHHVARCHLKLAQLWRCTVWRGTPQDLMDHILDGHNVPGGDQKRQLGNAFSSMDSHTIDSQMASGGDKPHDVATYSVCRVPVSSTFGHVMF